MKAVVIREQRQRLSLSQEDLARRVGVTRQTILNLESGRYNPSYRTVRALARTFEIPLPAFVEMLEESDERREAL